MDKYDKLVWATILMLFVAFMAGATVMSLSQEMVLV